MKRRSNGDGEIRRRPNGFWEGRVRLGWVGGRQVRRSVYGKTRVEVQKKIREMQQQLADGVRVFKRAPLLSEYLQHWLDVTSASVRPKTATSHEGHVRLHIVPALGHIRLDELTPQHVERLVATKTRTNLSPRSVQLTLHTLRAALNHAVRTDLLSRNVAKFVRSPHVPARAPTFLEPDQARRLIETTRGDGLGPLITLCVTTGLRRGEALGLLWSNVDLELGRLTVTHALQRVPGKGLILVEPKTQRSRRRLELPRRALDALREQRDRQDRLRSEMGPLWTERQFVFSTTVGQPLDPDNFRRDFKRLLRAADVPSIRFYDLRHTAASLLLAEGVHPRIVMEMLGHSQIALTMNTYSHVMPPLMGEAAKAMDRVLDAGDDR